MQKLTLAEQTLKGREFQTGLTQHPIYCYTCNLIMPKDTLAKRYDAATYTHETCPNTVMKTYSAHRYGS